jgi:hypothetical protein
VSEKIDCLQLGNRYVNVDGEVVRITGCYFADDTTTSLTQWLFSDNSEPERKYTGRGEGIRHSKHLCLELADEEDPSNAIRHVNNARNSASRMFDTEYQTDGLTRYYVHCGLRIPTDACVKEDTVIEKRPKTVPKGRVIFRDSCGLLSVSSGDYTEKEFREMCLYTNGWEFVRVLTDVPEFPVVEVEGG